MEQILMMRERFGGRRRFTLTRAPHVIPDGAVFTGKELKLTVPLAAVKQTTVQKNDRGAETRLIVRNPDTGNIDEAGILGQRWITAREDESIRPRQQKNKQPPCDQRKPMSPRSPRHRDKRKQSNRLNDRSHVPGYIAAQGRILQAF